jgi:hypothetical protein
MKKRNKRNKRNKVEVPVEITARIVNDIIQKEYFRRGHISALDYVMNIMRKHHMLQSAQEKLEEIENKIMQKLAKLEKK